MERQERKGGTVTAHPPREQAVPIDPGLDARLRRARHRSWDVLAVIALGGGLGSVARYLLGQAIATPPDGFPWATFAVNVSGCFALGLLMVYVLEVWPPRRYLRPFLGVGFLGGYTTFSTFTVEILQRLRDGAWTLADAYALDSLVAGLVAVWCGLALARLLSGLTVRRGKTRTGLTVRPGKTRSGLTVRRGKAGSGSRAGRR
jgi:CrcB protein